MDLVSHRNFEDLVDFLACYTVYFTLETEYSSNLAFNGTEHRTEYARVRKLCFHVLRHASKRDTASCHSKNGLNVEQFVSQFSASVINITELLKIMQRSLKNSTTYFVHTEETGSFFIPGYFINFLYLRWTTSRHNASYVTSRRSALHRYPMKVVSEIKFVETRTTFRNRISS